MSRALIAGVDFGGTNLKIGLVTPEGRVVATDVLPSKQVASPKGFVEAVAASVSRLARAEGVAPSQLRGVGVGAPGPVDAQRGIVRSTVNVRGWRDVPLAGLLSRKLKCRCVVENDAKVFTLGEWRFGAGRGAQHLIGMTLGTGIGGGLILGGALYRGSVGAAGEIGHMVIAPDGPRCGCGTRGCLEAHAGTRHILRLGHAAMRRSEDLRRRVRQAGGRLTPRIIGQAGRKGDAASRDVWREVGRWLGIGIGNLVNLFNPECVVIGGGVANNWSLFSPVMQRTVREQAMDVPRRAVKIVRGRLGNHAGIVGAAVLVWSRHETA